MNKGGFWVNRCYWEYTTGPNGEQYKRRVCERWRFFIKIKPKVGMWEKVL